MFRSRLLKVKAEKIESGRKIKALEKNNDSLNCDINKAKQENINISESLEAQNKTVNTQNQKLELVNIDKEKTESQNRSAV
jgi:hypothetical protein